MFLGIRNLLRHREIRVVDLLIRGEAMKIKSSAFAVIGAGMVIGAVGCGTSSSPSVATGTSVLSARSSTSAQATAPAADPKPAAIPESAAAPEPAASPKPIATGEPAPNPSPVTTSDPAPASGPYGSGHGLCFDVNSALAAAAVASLAPPPGGDRWVVEGGSGDPIEAGCSGVLSYMTVDWQGIHPGTHILFFTNGTYLGTATSKAYGYTEVLGKTKDTVSVQYRWLKSDDALCCPEGGPSVVTFTLNGTSVQAKGQFPPDN